MAKRQIIVAYVPVIHRGYWQFFTALPRAKDLFVIGPDLIKETDYLRKDLRALSPADAGDLLEKSGLFDSVEVLSAAGIKTIDAPDTEVILPDEDISRQVAERFKKAKITFYPVFLRWDRRSIESASQTTGKEKISSKKADRELMAKAYQAATGSSDIWRRVGAVLLDKRGREIGVATNQGRPSPHSPWMEGDPRNVYKQGLAIETSVFAHSEAHLIAMAARKGISIDGGSMYVTTFPCPVCAKMIADSGIKNLYIGEGYGVLDGYRTLEGAGVSIYRVVAKDPADKDKDVWVPYKKPA